MNRTDLISDTLTIIRNANRISRRKVDIPASKMLKSILSILKDEGYIEDFKSQDAAGRKSFRVYLKFDENSQPLIRGIKRISKPSLRVYVDSRSIPDVLRGEGIAIISTSKGILTNKQAREKKVGGEVICYVW